VGKTPGYGRQFEINRRLHVLSAHLQKGGTLSLSKGRLLSILEAMKKFLLILFVTGFAGEFFAQEEAENAKPFDPKEEIVYDNKRYRVWNSYMTFGGLWGFNTQIPGKGNLPSPQFVGAMDLNFHIQKEYFQMGAFISGNTFYDKNNVSLHAGWGKRIEKNKYNFAAFGGINYSLYYPYNKDSLRFDYEARNDLGFYVAVQNFYKIKYDIGIGGTVFAEYNSQRIIYGLRIELFFSGAYRGEKGRRKTN
jgi:hypothetical protein